MILHKISKNNIIKYVLFALVPLISAVLLCVIGKVDIFQYNCIKSTWNDEAIFYKLVKDILAGGYPRGYYGYMEVSAKFLSFGTWSPIVLLFYVIYGLFFGWNAASPLLANLLFMCLSFGAFAAITKASKKQLILISFLYICYMFATRYLFSAMSESFFFFTLIILIALSYRLTDDAIQSKHKGAPILLMFCIIFLITIARPFYVILCVVPYYIMRKNGFKRAGLYTIFAVILSLAAYFLLTSLLSAPYFVNNMYSFEEFLAPYATGGIWGVVSEFAKYVFSRIIMYLKFVYHAFTVNDISSAAYLTLSIIIFFSLVNFLTRKKSNSSVLSFIWLIPVITVLLSILFLYSPDLSYRHFASAILIMIFVLGMEYCKQSPHPIQHSRIFRIVSVIIISAALVYNTVSLLNTKNYSVPVSNKAEHEKIEAYESLMAENITQSEELSWENTILWLMFDYSGDWKYESDASYDDVLYAPDNYLMCLPAGIGINYIGYFNLATDFSNVKSKYFFTVPNSIAGKNCLDSGGKLLISTDEWAIYITPKYVH